MPKLLMQQRRRENREHLPFSAPLEEALLVLGDALDEDEYLKGGYMNSRSAARLLGRHVREVL
ncbi:hypothetical protein [Nannocystis pusilla]|uniref:hypothetical protein n=1 Tax=Nannocystis pusilla TaxID=889268 RepID=UPI003B8105C5